MISTHEKADKSWETIAPIDFECFDLMGNTFYKVLILLFRFINYK